MKTVKVINNNGYSFDKDEVQVSVTVDGYFEYCSHTNQTIEYFTFMDGTDQEYGENLSVCDKCGAAWDQDGDQRIEPKEVL